MRISLPSPSRGYAVRRPVIIAPWPLAEIDQMAAGNIDMPFPAAEGADALMLAPTTIARRWATGIAMLVGQQAAPTLVGVPRCGAGHYFLISSR